MSFYACQGEIGPAELVSTTGTFSYLVHRQQSSACYESKPTCWTDEKVTAARVYLDYFLCREQRKSEFKFVLEWSGGRR